MTQRGLLPDGLAAADIRLVVSDMDGTLLDDAGRVPEAFWPLLADMTARGIAFVPASGRQYYTLAEIFAPHPGSLSYIAENGSMVMHDGELLASSNIDPSVTAAVVDTVRAAAAAGRRLYLIVHRIDGAFIESEDDHFIGHARHYCARLEHVADQSEIPGDAVKLAIFDADDAETSAALFTSIVGDHKMAVSGHHWIDITAPGTHKATGVAALQELVGAGPENTVAFGDYLNDLEMLDAAEWSFAMSNAHPEVLERARYRAPTNLEAGVVAVLAQLLEE
ncbi:Cof-type HAD-IIB family hydrolase [Gordonia hydrophobica]|uniref:Cof-type HAD-IIB family hydrolase n=1 Tax=Gordonia hydrophobica TaxID=40516 RepID=A0ABZ2TXI0_9ACTN|nr:Cof-type HAD-IIB family hydrolase [Gordonia hydrophobica]MBM7366325.1 Cof subfamily protein (haloacid dehalogenase superfamily) [Gordonia hydrophobica]